MMSSIPHYWTSQKTCAMKALWALLVQPRGPGERWRLRLKEEKSLAWGQRAGGTAEQGLVELRQIMWATLVEKLNETPISQGYRRGDSMSQSDLRWLQTVGQHQERTGISSWTMVCLFCVWLCVFVGSEEDTKANPRGRLCSRWSDIKLPFCSTAVLYSRYLITDSYRHHLLRVSHGLLH